MHAASRLRRSPDTCGCVETCAARMSPHNHMYPGRLCLDRLAFTSGSVMGGNIRCAHAPTQPVPWCGGAARRPPGINYQAGGIND